jgi:hypothetical protein
LFIKAHGPKVFSAGLQVTGISSESFFSTTFQYLRFVPINHSRLIYRPIRLAYQPSVSSTFLSEQTSQQQPASSTFLSEQTSTSISHQPNEQAASKP